jgi:glycosyltransferase involved in cell wall biosynthesis
VRTLLVYKELPGLTASGGIGTYAGILSRALAQRGIDTHVLCVDPSLSTGTISLDGVTVHTAPLIQPRGVGRLTGFPAAWGRLTHAASVAWAYRRLRIRFDVVEAPELYAEGLFIARRGRVPVVIRLHSSAAQLFPYLGRTGRDARATIALENAAIHAAQIVTSTASNLAETTADLGLDPARTRAIIYPVRPQPLAPRPERSSLVLSVGRLEALKGTDTLIRAIPGVLEAIPDARFRFVGSDTHGEPHGSYQAYLERLAGELGVRDAVEFAGAIAHEDVFAEMTRAAVCAFPSRSERFGLVAAEAGSIGAPVVVSDIPGFLDYVEDGVTGYVAPVEAPDIWARQIVRAIRDPASASAMGARLRESIRARAHPRVVAELTAAAHEAAVQRWRSLNQRR